MQHISPRGGESLLGCVAVYKCVLQYIYMLQMQGGGESLLGCVAVYECVLRYVYVCCGMYMCVAVYICVLQYMYVCCRAQS